MSASEVILRMGPDYPLPENLHYKPVDLSTEWVTPSSHPKSDLITSYNDIPKPQPYSWDMDCTKKLQRSNFEFLTTLGYAEISSPCDCLPWHLLTYLRWSTGTFARVWLVKPTKEASGRVDASKVYALKVLRNADGMYRYLSEIFLGC